MSIQHISAVTLAVRDMKRSIGFYKKLGMDVTYGGEESYFSTLRAGETAINLILAPARQQDWWGRFIVRVDDVDLIHRRIKEVGLDPEEPRSAAWGERFFHIWDPDGHEISLAQRLPLVNEGKP